MFTSLFVLVRRISAFKQAMASSMRILHYDNCPTFPPTTQNRESQWIWDKEAAASTEHPKRWRQSYSLILRKYLTQNLIIMSHLFSVLLMYIKKPQTWFCWGLNDITRNSPKSSLGCNPGFESPFFIIMRYDKSITRNYVLKQSNIKLGFVSPCIIIHSNK